MVGWIHPHAYCVLAMDDILALIKFWGGEGRAE